MDQLETPSEGIYPSTADYLPLALAAVAQDELNATQDQVQVATPRGNAKERLRALEIGPAGDKLLKRSRRGCLTWQEKKCPEQYDGDTCLRCKEGGWKCVRAYPAEASSSSPAIHVQPTRAPSIPTNLANVTGSSEQRATLQTLTSSSDFGALFTLDDLFTGSANLVTPPSFTTEPKRPVSHTRVRPDDLAPVAGKILDDFYDQCILTAWTVTYPPRLRSGIAIDYHRLTAHELNTTCRRAAAAAYLTFFQRQALDPDLPLKNQHKIQQIPTDTMALRVDVDAFLRDAIIKARQPNQSTTVDAYLWALSDLHIGISSVYPAQRVLTIVELAEKVISLTFGDRFSFDAENRLGHYLWNLRAFAMIDLNRALFNRVPTFFNFDAVVDPSVGYPQDRSHDIWFGMPCRFVTLFARLANMTVTPTDPAAAATLRHEFEYTVPHAGDNCAIGAYPSTYLPELVTEQEIWRHTALLLLDLNVLQLPRSSPSIRSRSLLILNFARALPHLSTSRIEEGPPILDWWSLFYSTPVFFAGALLQQGDEADREFCRGFMDRYAPERSQRDLLEILEYTWRATDLLGGDVADWFEEARKEELSVTLM